MGKMHKKNPYPSLRRGLILGVFILASLGLPGPSGAQEEYTFVDESGKEVVFPSQLPVYTPQEPGPWKGKEGIHRAQLKAGSYQEGLETIRLLDITVPHPMEPSDDETGRMQAIYVLDKDDLIVGYYAFAPEEREARAKIWLNGTINYVQVYVHCSRHGLWREEFRLKI